MLSSTCVENRLDTIREALTCRREAIVRRAGGRSAFSIDERHELGEIDAALGRISRGSYGHCERCGHAIGWQWLRAVPEGRHCPSCVEPAPDASP